MISTIQSVLGLASGMLVGFSLGLVGGGGSILAVPLMVYVVGVPEPPVAIGTSAIAVAAHAAANLSNHARGGPGAPWRHRPQRQRGARQCGGQSVAAGSRRHGRMELCAPLRRCGYNRR